MNARVEGYRRYVLSAMLAVFAMPFFFMLLPQLRNLDEAAPKRRKDRSSAAASPGENAIGGNMNAASAPSSAERTASRPAAQSARRQLVSSPTPNAEGASANDRAPTAAVPLQDQLAQLTVCLSSGLITQDEYDTMRKGVLSRAMGST
jgi:hypothetical protein